MSEKRLSILESIKQKLKRFDNKPLENKSFEKNDLEDDFNYNIKESSQKQELIENKEDLQTNSNLENIKKETQNLSSIDFNEDEIENYEEEFDIEDDTIEKIKTIKSSYNNFTNEAGEDSFNLEELTKNVKIDNNSDVENEEDDLDLDLDNSSSEEESTPENEEELQLDEEESEEDSTEEDENEEHLSEENNEEDDLDLDLDNSSSEEESTPENEEDLNADEEENEEDFDLREKEDEQTEIAEIVESEKYENRQSLLKQEVIDSTSQLINKLITASNIAKSMEEMANQVDIEKIAIEAMMPKIEEWLNNNLTELVEKIVREEISKIIPQK